MTQALQGIHHSAFRCRDAEETRAFYEDKLGLKLAAALALDAEPGSGRSNPFMHIFFALPDGNHIAFFDAPSTAEHFDFSMTHGFDRHIAFEAASLDDLAAWQDRLKAAGVFVHGPLDHDFVKSIYFWDPNGLQLEITARVAEHDAIMAHEAEQARAVLADWTRRKVAETAAA